MAATACFKTVFCENGQSTHFSVIVAPSTKHTPLKYVVYRRQLIKKAPTIQKGAIFKSHLSCQYSCLFVLTNTIGLS